MMKYLPILAMIIATSCVGSRHVATIEPLTLNQQEIKPAPLPQQHKYRISGPATAANVPVQVNAEGKIVSFPAPTDLIGQEPKDLGDGWYLDRRGVNANTRFTTYTYEQYSRLSAPPSLAELQAAIIPDARVIDLTPYK